MLDITVLKNQLEHLEQTQQWHIDNGQLQAASEMAADFINPLKDFIHQFDHF